MSNMRTIRVTGRGQLKVHPDMTRIIITLEGRHKEYGETLQRSSRDAEQLKDILSKEQSFVLLFLYARKS